MKKRIKAISAWIKNKIQAITPGANATTGAIKALYWCSGILFALSIIIMCLGLGDPWMFVFFILFVGLLILAAYLANVVIAKTYAIPKRFRLAILICIPLTFQFLAFDGVMPALFLICTALLGAGLGVLFKTGFKNLTIIRKIATIIGLLIGFSFYIAVFILYIPAGFDVEQPINAALLNAEKIPHIQVSSPAEKGRYPVKTLTYGSGKDKHRKEFGEEATLKTDSINGVAFIDNWSGFGGWYREH